MNPKNFIKKSFEGVLIGLANVIPGVSGGSIALILGIYERLIMSINSIPISFPKYLIYKDFEGLKERVKKIDYPFLVPLVLGIALSTIGFARIMGHLLETYTVVTFSLFFGLILASAGTLYIRLEKISWQVLLTVFIGVFFGFITADLPFLNFNHSLFIIFISGALAIVSMILPGISGSFILVYLQQYEYMLNALNTLDIPVIIIFIIGGCFGLFSFAKGVEYLFRKYKGETLGFLFGLMLGSLRIPFEEIFYNSPGLWEAIIPAIIGFFLVVILEYRYHTVKE
ncbi:MAG: DUF368 domain-containing protein [Thermoplasmatota archaeon]